MNIIIKNDYTYNKFVGELELDKTKTNLLLCTQTLTKGGGAELSNIFIEQSLQDYNYNIYHLHFWSNSFGAVIDMKKHIVFGIGNGIKPYMPNNLNKLFDKFDIVHTNNYMINMWNTFIKSGNYKMVYSYLGHENCIKPIQFKCMDKLTTNRKSATNFYKFLEYLPAPYFGGNIDINDRQNIRYQYNLNDNDLLIITLARIYSGKAQASIIEPINRIVKSNPKIKIKVLLIGFYDTINAPFAAEYSSIVNQIKMYNLESNIEIIEQTDNVYPYIAAADLHLFPSLSEGMSLAVCESMYNKLPVIARQDLNNGIHVPGQTYIGYSNNNEIVNIINKFIYNRNIYNTITNNAYDMVNNFDIRSAGAIYDKFYNELLKK